MRTEALSTQNKLDFATIIIRVSQLLSGLTKLYRNHWPPILLYGNLWRIHMHHRKIKATGIRWLSSLTTLTVSFHKENGLIKSPSYKINKNMCPGIQERERLWNIKIPICHRTMHKCKNIFLENKKSGNKNNGLHWLSAILEYINHMHITKRTWVIYYNAPNK